MFTHYYQTVQLIRKILSVEVVSPPILSPKKKPIYKKHTLILTHINQQINVPKRNNTNDSSLYFSHPTFVSFIHFESSLLIPLCTNTSLMAVCLLSVRRFVSFFEQYLNQLYSIPLYRCLLFWLSRRRYMAFDPNRNKIKQVCSSSPYLPA